MLERAKPDAEVRRFYQDGPVPAGGLRRGADPIRYAIGPGRCLALKEAVVLHVGNPPEGSERCRTRLPDSTSRRNWRRSEERHDRECKESEDSTNATFHDYLLFIPNCYRYLLDITTMG